MTPRSPAPGCAATAWQGTWKAEGDLAEPKKVKVPRTPWNMLRKRRWIEELEELLKERLEIINQAAAAASLATGRGHEPRSVAGPLAGGSNPG